MNLSLTDPKPMRYELYLVFIYLLQNERFSWPIVRIHLLTLALCMGHSTTWRVPREAFRYGGLPYALVLTVASVAVALPVTLLQLAVGQLSQQNCVGIWRAVPFFRGIGYLRLLTTCIASIYTIIYLALTASYFLYTARNSIPFSECSGLNFLVESENYVTSFNSTTCLDATFMAPIREKPEYYIANAFIVVVLWIVFPFLLYSPVKMVKKIFYTLGPVIFVLGIVIWSSIGSLSYFRTFNEWAYWRSLLMPNVWHSAVVQALWSAQIPGGFLILAGDTLYTDTNVQWTSLILIVSLILSSWAGSMFWHSIGGLGGKDTDPLAVLSQMYQMAEDNGLGRAWPLLVFLTLFLSGVITMVTLLYPIYDHYRCIGGYKWRLVCAGNSVVGIALTLAVLAGRLPAISMLDDTVMPFLVSVATVLEILVFIFIYGWTALVGDVEFLTGSKITKYWVWGWYASSSIIVVFTAWWLVMIFLDASWAEPAWDVSALLAFAAVTAIVIIVFAIIAVVKQVQYDIISKLKSSFQPSRHWGPRDPIAHYYWLARRGKVEGETTPQNRYQRRYQRNSGPSSLDIPDAINYTNDIVFLSDSKRRANSDDWLYTGHRRKYLEEIYKDHCKDEKKRSVSLDLTKYKNIFVNKNLFKKKKESIKAVLTFDTVVAVHVEESGSKREVERVQDSDSATNL